LAPLVVLAIGIAGLVFEPDTARTGIVREIGDTVGQPAASALEKMILEAAEDGSSKLAALVGAAVLLFGASGVFLQLQDALNTIWRVAPKPGRGLWIMLRDRLLSFALVLGTGFLLLVSLVVSAGLAAMGSMLRGWSLPGGVLLWQGVHMVLSFTFITLLFALIFKLLPDAKIAWRDVWIGALVTALLFNLGKYLIGLYIGQSGTTSAFGAAASLVLILVWVYYSSQILLLGAEFTRVYANRYGAHVIPADNAVSLVAGPTQNSEASSCARQEARRSSAETV
jgi:membrane protein